MIEAAPSAPGDAAGFPLVAPIRALRARPRLLHTISGLQTGGAERMLVALLGALAPYYDQSVVALVGGPISQAVRDLGIPLCELSRSSTWTALLRLRAAERFAELVKPDLIQGWMYNGNLLGQLLANRRHIACIWGVHHSLYSLHREKLPTRVAIRANKRWSAGASHIVYVSQRSKEQHSTSGFAGERASVIANGFDIGRLQRDPPAAADLRVRLGIADSAPLVGIVARFHPMKDHANFLQAARHVAAAIPAARFLMVGRGIDGPEAGLASLADSLGLAGRVHLVGELSNVVPVLSALDVLCVSSAWGEAFPIVLGEALACGTPCVTTEVGDAARVVGPGGFVVPARDAHALADAVTRVLKMPAEERVALGQRGREHVISNFSLERIAAEYRSIYEAQLAKQPRAREGQR